jgi:hypothetical protein
MVYNSEISGSLPLIVDPKLCIVFAIMRQGFESVRVKTDKCAICSYGNGQDHDAQAKAVETLVSTWCVIIKLRHLRKDCDRDSKRVKL